MLLCAAIFLTSCGDDGGSEVAAPVAAPSPTPTPTPIPTEKATSRMGTVTVDIAPAATFANPWAFNFLPDGRMLVTDAFAGLRIVTQLGVKSEAASGLPADLNVPYDVVPSPSYATDHTIFLSYSELGPGGVRLTPQSTTSNPISAGLAVLSATLATPVAGPPALTNVKTIWRQTPKNGAAGEYGGKLAFSPDGKYLFITAGDRSTFTGAQQLENTLGKIVRIFPDGTIPADNPGAGKPGVAPELWSLGHRNSYGLAFDVTGQLWESEHGPAGGDEFNLIDFGANYGWPTVSLGNNYDGGLIQKPSSTDPFNGTKIDWTPTIAPAGMIFYKASLFRSWQNDAIVGGLQSKGLVIVRTSGRSASELDRLPLNARIRDVRQAPDGAIWVLEDSPTGRLLRLTPAG